MDFNPLRYSIRLRLHPGKIPGSAPGARKILHGSKIILDINIRIFIVLKLLDYNY
jgi:hypothetical protein